MKILDPAIGNLSAARGDSILEHLDANPAMDAFAQSVIRRFAQTGEAFSLKMEGVSADVLEAELLEEISKLGVLRDIPHDTQIGLEVETSGDSGDYCAKLEIGNHTLRIFLAASAHELNLDDEECAYSEMRIYDGQGGKVQVDPPFTMVRQLTMGGETTVQNNALDPMKYDALKKETANGPKLVTLYYHSGHDSDNFAVENDADKTLSAILSALMSGEQPNPELLQTLLDNEQLSPEALELIESVVALETLLADMEGVPTSEVTSEQVADAADLQESIEALMDGDIDLPEAVVSELQDKLEVVQEPLGELSLIVEGLEGQAAEVGLETADVEAVDMTSPDSTVSDVAEIVEADASELTTGEIDMSEEMSGEMDVTEVVDNEQPAAEDASLSENHHADMPEVAAVDADMVDGVEVAQPEAETASPAEIDSAVESLKEALADVGEGTPEAVAIEQAIDNLENGVELTAADRDALASVQDKTNSLVADHIDKALTAIDPAEPVSADVAQNVEATASDHAAEMSATETQAPEVQAVETPVEQPGIESTDVEAAATVDTPEAGSPDSMQAETVTEAAVQEVAETHAADPVDQDITQQDTITTEAEAAEPISAEVTQDAEAPPTPDDALETSVTEAQVEQPDVETQSEPTTMQADAPAETTITDTRLETPAHVDVAQSPDVQQVKTTTDSNSF